MEPAQVLTISQLQQIWKSLSNKPIRIIGILVSHDKEGKFIRLVDPLAPQNHPSNPYKKNTVPVDRDGI